jgi:uncharacterized protein YggE
MTEAKHWFWVLLDALLAALIIGFLGVGLPTAVRFVAGVYPARTISVTAQGKTTVTPDLAEINFSVLTQGQNPQTLTTNNTEKMNAVLQFVSSQNIASSDIKTTGYDLQPNYQYDKNTLRNFITGYTLTQTVTVKIRDLTNVATVLSGLAPLGVNQIGGVSFTFADPDSLMAVARANAINKVKVQAQQMAYQAGASLGEVVSVSENGVAPGPIPYYNKAAYSTADSTMGGAPVPTIAPGSQDVTDNVTITYALL